MDFLPFAIDPKYTPAQIEIRNWIQQNRKTLEGRTSDEVASLAVTCGFDISDVCLTLADFHDAMAGTNIDNRAAFQSWIFDRKVAEVTQMKRDLEKVKELDLMPLWKELVANTVTGE